MDFSLHEGRKETVIAICKPPAMGEGKLSNFSGCHSGSGWYVPIHSYVILW